MAFLRAPALLLAALIATASCFSPKQPACAFSCAEDGACPAGYSCQADGVCHRDDDPGTCGISSQVDASAVADANADVDVDGAGADTP